MITTLAGNVKTAPEEDDGHSTGHILRLTNNSWEVQCKNTAGLAIITKYYHIHKLFLCPLTHDNGRIPLVQEKETQCIKENNTLMEKENDREREREIIEG